MNCLREKNVGLKEVCQFIVENYPEDIFTGEDISDLRDAAKRILEKFRGDEG